MLTLGSFSAGAKKGAQKCRPQTRGEPDIIKIGTIKPGAIAPELADRQPTGIDIATNGFHFDIEEITKHS